MDNKLVLDRRSAFLVDGLVLFVILLVGSLVFPLEKLIVRNLFIGFIYLLVIFKDIFKGQSLGKRVYKIIVVSEDGSPATLKQLIIRNIPLLIWPVEAYKMKDNVKPRIGDSLAKTKVIYKFDIEQ